MEDINQLLAIQEDRVLKINKAYSNYRKTPKQRLNICYLNTRLESLEKIWQSFIICHERIVYIVNKEVKSSSEYFTKDVFDETEEFYITYKSELKMRILELTQEQEQQSVNNSKHTTSTSSCAEIKLPTINLPTFSGVYTDWPSFHDLFISLVHNNSVLDNVQKLHYLKASLSGEAEQLLRTVTVTSDNYIQAWTTLNKRYSNKRYISNSIFKRLFALKPLTTESAHNIKLLLDTTVECLNLLKNIGLKTEYWDDIIVYMTVSKLDNESHKLWEQHITSESDSLPSLEILKQFMERRFRSLEMIEPVKTFRSEPSRINRPKTFHTTTATAQSIKCTLCGEAHYLYHCKQFAKKNSKERYEFVKNANLCFNCLVPNHSVTKCTNVTFCRICNKKHHSLLHPEKEATSGHTSSMIEETDPTATNITTHFINQPGQILLATALVDVLGRNKQNHIYRALIDQGSQASFVTESLVQTCGLKRERISGVISGLSEGKQLRTKYMVQLEIQSRHKPYLVFPVKAYVLKTLTSYLPTQDSTVCNWTDLEDMTLAYPGYNTPNRIDLLLGAEVYSKIIDSGLRKSPNGVIAQNTHLGWILSGDTQGEQPAKHKQIISMHICTCENKLLRQFWEIENETPTSERKFSLEERRCEDLYCETVTRTHTGRYKVKLPFKLDIHNPVEICGETKQMAITRFMKLEKKLSNDTSLKDEYIKVINEYMELGHMIIAKEENNNSIYLPHRAVVRNDKDTTKVRVVFDASAKGSKGFSLNDTLLVGPTIQKDLPTLLMTWRKYKIAIVSDIVKMYRQVLIADEDTELQRIVWRNFPHETIQFYKLLTVTFGTASAPYLAIRTLFQLAEDEGHKYPLAAEILKRSFYVDDLTTGCYTVEEGKVICEQLTQLLRCGGFELQKWASNSSELLEAISENKNINNQQTLSIKLDDNVKILGLTWDKQNDEFKFTVNIEELTEPITKRSILSDIARLFDPFGWFSPTIIIAKILIQKLWLCNAEWDEEVPNHLLVEWLKFRDELHELRKVHLNRWIHTYPDDTRVELHGFADASISAYAAVVYVKVIHNQQVNISILDSKTKVAPLKQISIARLELCAAVLVAKLLSKAAEVLAIPKEQVYAYTDSMIVLAWIQAQPMKWQTFVGNRVAEIQTLLQSDRWNHIISKNNPADLASRGVYPAELVTKEIWWNGPSWLSTQTMSIQKPLIPETEEEKRIQKIEVFHTNIIDEPIYTRFSKFNNMIRVLTYCRRLLHLKDKKEIRQKHTPYLNSEELRETLNAIIKIDQQKDFYEEIMDLKHKNKIKVRSKLIKLCPYLDEIGLLRVGGRLQNAKVAVEVKHPIILSQTSHLSWLFVNDAHAKLLHGGCSMMMNYLRSRYWIIGLKQAVKRCVRQCVVCTRHKALTSQPLMGTLPAVRVNPGRPFKYSGVDYAGPIQMRTTKGRGHKSYKGYICLFICLKTKAIHLEAVSDLTTSGFLAAFRRFTSRRGHCAEIWSDNGLNFVGAAQELRNMFRDAQSNFVKEVAELLSDDGTTWHFIPPKGPNFGGIWEAGIKSVKLHLSKVVRNTTLTYEEMSTLLSQIEACLNSRPLCQLNDHNDDLLPLTPAHFLVGEPLVTIPEKQYNEMNISALDRWHLVQRMTQHFWRRWSHEFLNTLQQRNKWNTQTKPPQIGDVVIIKEEDTAPTKWFLARIVQLHAGNDKIVRVATVKTKTSTLKRPISKLIVLQTTSNPVI